MDIKTLIVAKTNLKAIRAWIWIKLDSAKRRNANKDLIEDMEELVNMINQTTEGFDMLDDAFSSSCRTNDMLRSKYEALRLESEIEIRRLTELNERLKEGI
jgi:hypothetical protein